MLTRVRNIFRALDHTAQHLSVGLAAIAYVLDATDELLDSLLQKNIDLDQAAGVLAGLSAIAMVVSYLAEKTSRIECLRHSRLYSSVRLQVRTRTPNEQLSTYEHFRLH